MIDFSPAATSCPNCGKPQAAYKTRCRTVATLQHGTFKAREHLLRCDRTRPTRTLSCPTTSSDELARLVPPGQRFGYDLIVYVGLARYLDCKQRVEIQTDLQRRGVELSTGTITSLCDRFLSRLEALHLLRAPYLRAAMSTGWSLHLDATCDAGKGGLFVCMDGVRGWVLMAERINTENGGELAPVVQSTVELFGDPVATMRDMGKGMAAAVVSLRERQIPDLICHYHFLKAVGTALLGKPYDMVRSLLRLSGVRTRLNELARDLRRHRDSQGSTECFGSGQIRDDLLALVQWLRAGDGTADPVFPFGLPHLDLVGRCQQGLVLAQSWIAGPRTGPERRAIQRLGTVLRKVDKDPRMAAALAGLQQGNRVFSELRGVLRLGHAEKILERRQQPVPAVELARLRQIKAAVDAFEQELRQRSGPAPNPKQRRTPEAIVLGYLKRGRSQLFGHPAIRDEQGELIAVVDRTNNVPEHFFGQGKQRLRRRVGRARLARDLQQQPAQVALVANLRLPDYVRVLCGSIENLPETFAALDQGAVNNVKLRRDHRDAALNRRIKALLREHPRPPSGCLERPTKAQDVHHATES